MKLEASVGARCSTISRAVLLRFRTALVTRKNRHTRSDKPQARAALSQNRPEEHGSRIDPLTDPSFSLELSDSSELSGSFMATEPPPPPSLSRAD